MKLSKFVALVGVASLGLGAVANAGEGYDPHAVVRHIFEVADKDKSGTLTRAEYTEAGLQRFGVSFDDCDTNSDGETSLAEYFELYLRFHPSRDQSDV